MHSGCISSLQVSFTWPVATGLPRSCVHGAVTLGCLSVYPSSRNHTWTSRIQLFVSSCARLHGSPALFVLSSFPAYHVSCVLESQCLGVAFGVVEKAPLLGCFLTPECFDFEVLTTAVSTTSRHHAACSCPSLQLTTLLHCLSERWCHVSSNSFGAWCFTVCSLHQNSSCVLYFQRMRREL